MADLTPFKRKNDNAISPSPMRPFNMIDDFFGEAFSSLQNFRKDFGSGSFKIDVSETEIEYLIEAELPDVLREEINLSLNEDKLTISVERNEEIHEANKNKSYIHKERHYRSMQRSLYLANVNTDPEKVQAKLENGLLEIVIPKKEIKEKTDTSQKIKIE